MYSLFKKICWLLSLIITGFVLPSYAQITLDGSLGTARTLPGPDYMIGAELGRTVGDNLFHSFEEFNINVKESATFTGPNHITSIIGRVTGENDSNINGVLNSNISNADFYLLNPNGIFIGPNAKLNIDGAFNLSSTDALRFTDGTIFDTHTLNPQLTIAPPETFGFLSNIGNIKIEGNIIENTDKDFSVTAGNLEIINSGIDSSTLDGQAGNILLQATESIIIVGSAIISQALPQGSGQTGNIILNSPAIGIGAGTIIGTSVLGTGDGGNVQIEPQRLIIDNSSAIFTYAENTGSGGNIDINVAQLELRNNSRISTETKGQGNSGQIKIHATDSVKMFGDVHAENLDRQINCMQEEQEAVPTIDKTAINTDTKAQGKAGNIIITTPSLEVDGGYIQAATIGEGNAGNITLNIKQLKLYNGGKLEVSSAGIGHGGSVEIRGLSNNKADTIEIVGKSNNQPSGISSSAEHIGNGGTISITAQTLSLDQEGTIQTLTQGYGGAGNIKIDVHDLNIMNKADIDASNEGCGYGKGGDIDIIVTDNALITAELVSSKEALEKNKGFIFNQSLGGIYSVAKRTGHGGNITLSAKELTLRENGVISSRSTAYDGDGGNINLNTNELYISSGDGWIDVTSEFGLNGEFILNSTKLKDDFLALPPPKFIDADLSINHCNDFNQENMSSLKITDRNGLTSSPGDLMP